MAVRQLKQQAAQALLESESLIAGQVRL